MAVFLWQIQAKYIIAFASGAVYLHRLWSSPIHHVPDPHGCRVPACSCCSLPGWLRHCWVSQTAAPRGLEGPVLPDPVRLGQCRGGGCAQLSPPEPPLPVWSSQAEPRADPPADQTMSCPRRAAKAVQGCPIPPPPHVGVERGSHPLRRAAWPSCPSPRLLWGRQGLAPQGQLP